MSSKKNIDRLFQEKFKDFEAKPDPKVWQNIHSKLKEEEEDNKPIAILPLWLKLSGIAASFILLLVIGNTFFSSPSAVNTPTTVDNPNPNNNTIKYSPTLNEKQKLQQNNSTINNATTTVSEPINKDNNTIVTNSQDPKNTTTKGNNNKDDNANLIQQQSASNYTNSSIVTNSIQNKHKVTNSNYNNQSNNLSVSSNKITTDNQTKQLQQSVVNNKKNSEKQPINVTNKDHITKAITQENIATNTTIKDTIQQQKPSIEDAIANNKATEDLIEKEEEANNRWNVYANIAPVYYNAFGEGSHIDEQFNKNNKSGEVNTSYGVKVGYTLNDKLTIRSGINKLNLSYDTDDVIVYQNVSTNPSPKEIRNIDFNPENNQSINIISSNSLLLGNNNSSLIKNVGLSQRISYYEVPVEIEYAVVNNQFSLNLIGGLSTFVLDDNKLVSEFDGFKMEIGSANNINNLSFSANFGVGLNYKFSESVIFNFEPTFKYQLNAFSDTSGNFNPYIIGVYTGFSYRF
ncbi:hypothetical protein [Olleya marilimosa]|uniref:hypothetical protein n=1 Tax=Olleya marilimosa TaxID=272164 RepID=UPI0030EB86CE|tara:strand:+ start:177849 stop:179393 length:1545 start_codon:yes stop_codon:yes gene_type:complete